MSTRYINTDLYLIAPYDPRLLANALEAKGISHIQIIEREDGHWYAAFETTEDHTEPETTISAMLDGIETLEGEAYRLWSACSVREFDIGYQYGSKPDSFQQGLTNATLLRVSNVGAGLKITLYGSVQTDRSRQTHKEN